jgi:hypothetical protein
MLRAPAPSVASALRVSTEHRAVWGCCTTNRAQVCEDARKEMQVALAARPGLAWTRSVNECIDKQWERKCVAG